MEDDSQLQRRIELQDRQDLAYLITNVRDAATARLNEAFPQIAGQTGEDDLRIQIEALVNQYIDETFTLAAPNLSINGMDVRPESFLRANRASESDTQPYEPFDADKRRNVADLIAQEEKLLEEVAALKRSIPAEAAEQYTKHINDTAKRDEDVFQQRLAALPAATKVQMNVEGLERQQGVEAQFRTAVEALNRLQRDMPSVVAKMDRARVAGEYVVNDAQS